MRGSAGVCAGYPGNTEEGNPPRVGSRGGWEGVPGCTDAQARWEEKKKQGKKCRGVEGKMCS